MDSAAKTFTVKIIPIEGDIQETQIGPTLKELQAAIGGGHIECVRTAQGMMIVDDEGLLKGLPNNPRASLLYSGPTGIAGVALLFTYAEWDALDREFA